MILFSIGIMLFSHIIHEFGHWVAYKAYGYSPSVKIKWSGTHIGDNIGYLITPKQSIVITTLGILTGLLPLFIFSLPIGWFFIYIVSCSVDIADIIGCWEMPKNKWNTPLYKVLREQVKPSKMYP